MDKVEKVEVAIAILHQNHQFLMQLRDDIPTILYPGHWCFFGGHLEPGEDPNAGVCRELEEEIGYVPPNIDWYQRVEDERIIRNFFQAELTVPISTLVLSEGQDLGLCSITDVHRGFKYAAKLGEDRPLGAPHRQALISFIQHSRWVSPTSG